MVAVRFIAPDEPDNAITAHGNELDSACSSSIGGLRACDSMPQRTIGAIGTMERRDVQCDQYRGKGKREKGVGDRGAAWRGGWPLRFVVRRWARRCQP